MKVTKAHQADIEARRDTVAQLLKARLTYREIAKAVSCSIGTVAADARVIFKRWAERQFENIQEQALLDLGLMDDAIRAIVTNVRSGDLASIDRLVKLVERRARLLGLDAPTKVAPTDPSGTRKYRDIDELSDEVLLAAIADRERRLSDASPPPAGE